MRSEPFPLLGVLESILAWQRDPTEANRRNVGDAVGLIVSTVGARGSYLEGDAVVLPGLSVGWGTYEQGVPDPRDAQCVELRSQDARLSLASLWIDGDIERVGIAIRGLELALEGAWFRAEARQAANRLEALDAATRGIAGLVSLDRVLQDIADRVRDLIGAEYAALGIVDEFGVIERFVTSGISDAQRERIGALPRGHGLLGLIIREGRSYRIPDIAADPSSAGFPPDHPPMHSFLGVPLLVKGRSIGNFYLTNKRNAPTFSESDQRLVEMFALHAGVAIENARLHEQVRRHAIVDERVRIGKDLHDGIIQAIYAVGLSLEDVPDLMAYDPPEAAVRVDRAIDALNLTIRDIRNFIFGLRPELAGQAGLLAGLAALANEFRINSTIDVELDAPETIPDVGAHRRGELLKVVREALSNIARHSRATRAMVRAGLVEEQLELVISDNGGGFDVEAPRGRQHQGIPNMRARIRDLGGQVIIESEPGTGTRVTIRVPAAPEIVDRGTTTGGSL